MKESTIETAVTARDFLAVAMRSRLQQERVNQWIEAHRALARALGQGWMVAHA